MVESKGKGRPAAVLIRPWVGGKVKVKPYAGEVANENYFTYIDLSPNSRSPRQRRCDAGCQVGAACGSKAREIAPT